MRIRDEGRKRSLTFCRDGHGLALGHVDDLARPGRHGSRAARNGKHAFQDDHDIVDSHCLRQALPRTVTAVSNGDWPTVLLVDQISDENVAVLSRRPNKLCVTDTFFAVLPPALLRWSIQRIVGVTAIP